jgi:hypothetical protein
MKKLFVLLLLILGVFLATNSSNQMVYGQAVPSCYEHSGCSVISPRQGSWCATNAAGSPCFNTACDCS